MGSYYDIDNILAEEEVEQGSKVEVPLWLARELRQRGAVSVNVPACFDENTGDRTLCYLLFFAFRSRYKEVLTKGHTAAHVAAPNVLSRLTNEEINLYRAAQSSVAAFKKWRVGGLRFRPSSALGRKCKSTE